MPVNAHNSKETLLQVENLSCGYEENAPVLNGINLTVTSGTITSILGPNGSGKSTLLKTLCRQLKPLSGSIKFDGDDIWGMQAREFSQNCSFVPQFMNTNTSLTVKELISLGRNPHQNWWSWNESNEDRKAVNEAIEKTSLDDLENRMLCTLSGGEKQRSLIASALAQNSKLILMDEPISSLDFKHQLSVVSTLKELKSMNLAVIVVLHDLNVIDSISDHVVLINKPESGAGSIEMQGASVDVLTKDLLKTVFDVDVEVISKTDSDASSDRIFSLLEG